MLYISLQTVIVDEIGFLYFITVCAFMCMPMKDLCVQCMCIFVYFWNVL